jgi:two-component system, NtrC family, sensor kinase
MTLRLLLLSVAFGVLAVGVCFVSVAPLLDGLADALVALGGPSAMANRVREMVPGIAVLDGVVIGGLLFLALLSMIGFPLGRMGAVIESLERERFEGLESEGPLLARAGASLRSLSRALAAERQTNQTQLNELRQANAGLQRLQNDLVSADRLATVGKLAAGVAHEVGNPLAGILGYVSVLRARTQGEESVDLLNRVEAEVQRIDVIVRSLLELGRPARGGAEPFDARVVVDAATSLLRASADLQNVKVSVRAPEHLWVRGESGPLSQVLVNLLLNAGQAMNGQGEVAVILESEPPRVIVEDQGPGIPPDVLPRLFELFFTTKPAGKGTGLGLAMSRHLLAQFGATISAENRPTGGARFVVTLLPA